MLAGVPATSVALPFAGVQDAATLLHSVRRREKNV